MLRNERAGEERSTVSNVLLAHLFTVNKTAPVSVVLELIFSRDRP